MRHYQKQFECSICGKVIIIDFTSIGTTHQMVQGVTCLECAKNAPNSNIMGDKVEEIKFESPKIIENYAK